MRALLIEFDPQTGRRAGGIDPRDSGLFCYGWQNLDAIPALEIRLITDVRDASRYEGVPGVTVLRSDAEIDRAIDDHMPPRYGIENETVMRMHIERRGIDLDTYAGRGMKEVLADLHGKGVAGVRKIECLKMKDIRQLRGLK